MRTLLVIFTLLIFGLGYLLLHPQYMHAALSTNRLAAQQLALERYAASSTRIDEILKKTLAQVPSAARVRAAFVHLSTTSPDLLRFDITNAATRPGHPVGELTADHAISEWSDYFSTLMNDQCADVNITQVTSSISLERLRGLQIRRFYACPMFNGRHQLLGATFVSWDAGDPDPEDPAAVEQIIRHACAEVGRAKDEYVTRSGSP